MARCPSASTNPSGCALNASGGLNAFTCTTTDSLLGPEILTFPIAEPAGVRPQSTVNQSRCSLVTVPSAVLRMIQGSLTSARNSNGSLPRLNTSMHLRGRLKTSNPGNAAGSLAPGHAAAEPSMATPNEGPGASSISRTAGITLTCGCCQFV